MTIYIRTLIVSCFFLILSACHLQHTKPTAAGCPEPRRFDATAENDNATTEMDNLTEKEGRDAQCLRSPSGNLNPAMDRALDLCHLAQNFWHKGELDNALQTLDEAYATILEVDVSDDIRLFQQKEDLRFLISKRILEIYASRHVVANGFHKAIPLTVNQYVQEEIDRFTTNPKLRDFFIAAYRRSGRYRPYIIEQLQAAGLPESLSWLPLIESGFKTRALSKARALGLWQFIPSTGSKFGLNRDAYIDERLDPIKSTHAAIAYLKELHDIFGDWTTVLAAYNCGESRVLQTIRSQNVNYLDNFWDLYDRLPQETASYVPQFLATLHIVANLKKYGMDEIEVDPPLDFETLEVSRSVSLEQIAAATNLALDDLTRLNPELRQELLPPDAYSLRIPSGKGESLLSKIETIPIAQTPPQNECVYHKIQRGQTLSSIAMKYNISPKAITQANNLNRRCALTPGNLIKIPGPGAEAPQDLPAPPVEQRNAGTHTVRSGDSLWNIAKRYNTTTHVIRDMNSLPSDNSIIIGQILKIPGAAKPPPPQKSKPAKVYQVKQGDTAFSIATKHKMTLAQLLAINKMSENSRIYPGQELFVD